MSIGLTALGVAFAAFAVWAVSRGIRRSRSISYTLWAQFGECFDTDDGSLPGIELTGLSREGVAAIYAMLRGRSRLEGDPPEFWSRTEEAARPVDSVANAAELVATGRADPFHHCIAGLVAAGVELPVIGVFVFSDMIELDYRMGPAWGPLQVAGFFELLRDCSALDPKAVVAPATSEGPPYPERFIRAWDLYKKICPT
jgi:hypothetical protein